MKTLYNYIFIPIAKIIISLLKLFNNKLNEREIGAKISLRELIDLPKKNGVKRIWIHAASMGEFEQVKPIIELLKSYKSSIEIFVSFFSPSGYVNQLKYKFADKILYLPFDTKSNAKVFLDWLNPDFILWTRYDIWFNFLQEIKKRKIKSFLVCATKPRSSFFSSLFGKKYLNETYNVFDKIFTMDELSFDFFNSNFDSQKVIKSKDSRFDRIAAAIMNAKNNPLCSLPLKADNELCLLIGSSWRPDEEICINGRNILKERDGVELKIIAVPHEPTFEHIKELKSKLPDAILLSEIEQGKAIGDNKDIIVDSIGKLLALYSFADCVFIGGAFGAGVHSVTEPAGYGVPLATGMNISKSPDAKKLIELKALKQVNTSEEFYKWIKTYILDNDEKKRTGEIAKKYIFDNIGESEIITKAIIKNL